MPTYPTAHTGAALRHLRVIVFATAGVVGVALLAQILIWAFVHFTDVRWTEVETPPNSAAAGRVVVQSPPQAAGQTPATQQPTPANAQASRSPGQQAAASQPVGRPAQSVPVAPEVDPNRVPSPHERNLRMAALGAQTIGAVAVVVLAFTVFQGVLIASGANTPGVEKAVTASSWTLAITLLCLPIQSVVPAWPFAGVFSSYDAMTAASDALHAADPDAPTTASFYASFLFFPLLCFIALAIVVYRFYSGVESAALITSVSEAEHRLEREMSNIQIGNHAGGRTAGALSRAITVHSDDDFSPSPSLTRGGDNPLRRTRSKRDEDTGGRPISKPGAGDPLKRPI